MEPSVHLVHTVLEGDRCECIEESAQLIEARPGTAASQTLAQLIRALKSDEPFDVAQAKPRELRIKHQTCQGLAERQAFSAKRKTD